MVSRSAVVFKLGPPKATHVQQRQEQCNGKYNRSTDNGKADENPASDGQGGNNQIIEIDVMEPFDVVFFGPEFVE